MKRRVSETTLLALATVLAVACGNDGGSTAQSQSQSPEPDAGAGAAEAGAIEFFGQLNTIILPGKESIDNKNILASAELLELSDAQDVEPILNAFIPDQAVCSVSRNGRVDNGNTVLRSGTRVSGGETLQVMNDSGSLPDLILQKEMDDLQYLMELEIPINEALVGDRSVNIPGEAFPAFTDLSVPEARSVGGPSVSHEGNQVLSDSRKPQAFPAASRFVWRDGEYPGTFVRITLYTDSIYANSATCLMPESMRPFQFPESLRQTMDVEYSDLQISRVAFEHVVVDNAMVLLTTERVNALY